MREVRQMLAKMLSDGAKQRDERQTVKFMSGFKTIEIEYTYSSDGHDYFAPGRVNKGGGGYRVLINGEDLTYRGMASGAPSVNTIIGDIEEHVKIPKLKGGGGAGKPGLSALERARQKSGDLAI